MGWKKIPGSRYYTDFEWLQGRVLQTSLNVRKCSQRSNNNGLAAWERLFVQPNFSCAWRECAVCNYYYFVVVVSDAFLSSWEIIIMELMVVLMVIKQIPKPYYRK